jgi:hypothetical protein
MTGNHHVAAGGAQFRTGQRAALQSAQHGGRTGQIGSPRRADGPPYPAGAVPTRL